MQYAIVIDAGSSGSRALVYAFHSDAAAHPHELPSIHQLSNTKLKPGLSNQKGNSRNDLWEFHFQELLQSAAKIIPLNMHAETPIFIQATAGLRLLPPMERESLLLKTCRTINENTEFIITPCEEHVQVINGDTEGLYGWLALNYLTLKLTNVESNPYGFMDMGGASTQLAFVPTDPNHQDDLYRVALRDNSGTPMEWSVFVSSWLGFGANEARVRQLNALINVIPGQNLEYYDKNGDGHAELADPCSPKGMVQQITLADKVYSVTGTGDYEGCVKTLYPLLLKHLPCESEPCLFNGVHAPEFNFKQEKFVGVSEYWYTANDVFKLNGEYNYQDFEMATKEFCGSDWSIIEERFLNGEYGENLTLELLQASCFKASWIVNILHEGFGMPRLGVDDVSETSNEPVFKSVNNIDGHELSWTLGKMVLYASSQIHAEKEDGQGHEVGIFPGSTILGKIQREKEQQQQEKEIHVIDGDTTHSVLVTFSVFSLMACMFYYYILTKHGSIRKFWRRLRTENRENEEWINLEAGIDNLDLDDRHHHGRPSRSLENMEGTLRTRSTMNLHELSGPRSVSMPNSPNINNGAGSNVGSGVPSFTNLNVAGVAVPTAMAANAGDAHFQPDTLKHSFTYSSFRDHKKSGKLHFKLGNGSNASLK